MSALRLDGRVALVTGAGRWLGRVFARALADRGATVICLGRGGGGEQALAAEIVESGGQAVAETADVTDAAAVQAMAARVLDRHGRLDILVNNAGMTRDRSFAKVDMDDFRAVLDANLIGSAQVTAAFWPERPAGFRIGKMLSYGLLVLWDIMVANVQVAWIVLTVPNHKLKPAWITIPLDLRQPEAITLLAGTITLTPGTVSADLSQSGHYLLVHVLQK